MDEVIGQLFFLPVRKLKSRDMHFFSKQQPKQRKQF